MKRALPLLVGLLAVAGTIALAVVIAAVWPDGIGQGPAQQVLPWVLASSPLLIGLGLGARWTSRSWPIRVGVGVSGGVLLQLAAVLAATQLLTVDLDRAFAHLTGATDEEALVPAEPDQVAEAPRPEADARLLGASEPPLSYNTVWPADSVELPTLAQVALPERVDRGDARCRAGAELIEEEVERDGVVFEALSCKSAGVRDGSWWVFDGSGTLRERGDWSMGRRHGRWTWWSSDGAVSMDGSYDKGREHGLWTVDSGTAWKVFHEGTLLYEGMAGERTPDSDSPDVPPLECPSGSEVQGPANAEQCVKRDAPDVRHGPSRWIDQGRLRETVSYADGKREGALVTYFGPWNLDVLAGVCDPDCPKQRETPYVADLKHGTETTWHPNGQIASTTEWREGKACGTAQHYEADGAPSRQEVHPPCL